MNPTDLEAEDNLILIKIQFHVESVEPSDLEVFHSLSLIDLLILKYSVNNFD